MFKITDHVLIQDIVREVWFLGVITNCIVLEEGWFVRCLDYAPAHHKWRQPTNECSCL